MPIPAALFASYLKVPAVNQRESLTMSGKRSGVMACDSSTSNQKSRAISTIEADVWKAVFWHSLVLASLVGLVVLIYAYLVPWVIPG